MKKVVIATCATLLAGLLSAAPLRAANPAEDIPLDSWVYDAVFELSSQGFFTEVILHVKPYTRGEIAAGVRSLLSVYDSLPMGQRILVNRLQSEFSEELATASERISGDREYLRYGGGITARSDQTNGGYAKNRVGADVIGTFGVGSSFAARTRIRFDSDGRHDTQFQGEYWKENLTAWVDQAVITARLGRFRGAFGREFWRWGRSPVDAMLISDQSPPFNGLRLHYRSRRWKFSFYATMLDSMAMPNTAAATRYLVGHRLDWRPRHNLEMAVSEVVVFGGVNRPWALNYLNPLLPYYWEQLNNDTNDNPLWNLEISWRPVGTLEAYAEWLIDDFQIDFVSEPQQIGILIGGAWTTGPEKRLFVNAEFQRINTFVYGQSRGYNRYYHHRDLSGRLIGIGSNLGPDSERLTARPRWHLTRHVDIVGLLEHVRRGQDRIDSVQSSAVPKDTPFPSGTVEKRFTTGIGVHAQLGGQAVLDLVIGYERVSNIENVLHRDRDGLWLRLRLATLLWNTVRL